nr:hypothetical protein Iba_scaffold19876CG0010 [Ipomoea batatas]
MNSKAGLLAFQTWGCSQWTVFAQSLTPLRLAYLPLVEGIKLLSQLLVPMELKCPLLLLK